MPRCLPTGPENLVYRAIEADRPRDWISGRQSRRGWKSAFPVARGLGGGSSDAAAALIGMLRLTGKKMPLERLMEIAAGLGADVPFFLFGGRALAVEPRRRNLSACRSAASSTVLVVSPRGIGVSTRTPIAGYPTELTNRAKPPKIWGFCALCWSPQGAASRTISRRLSSGGIRASEKSETRLLQQGAAEAALAGSGSAVFGIFRNPAQARRAARAVSGRPGLLVADAFQRSVHRACGARGAGE